MLHLPLLGFSTLNIVHQHQTATQPLNPSALGHKMSFIVVVELERQSVKQLNAFRLAVFKEERVQQCYFITGEGDFTLICSLRDMEDFEDLRDTLFMSNPNVKRFRTSVIMERTKVSLEVPLDI
jgi:DNA-binding Lrp family transcriptional regulator